MKIIPQAKMLKNVRYSVTLDPHHYHLQIHSQVVYYYTNYTSDLWNLCKSDISIINIALEPEPNPSGGNVPDPNDCNCTVTIVIRGEMMLTSNAGITLPGNNRRRVNPWATKY